MDEATRVALVTGAARGIGAATTRRLSADGWAVVAVDRCADDPAVAYALGSRADLDRTVASCANPAAVIPVEADVRDEAALTDAVGLARDRFGGLDAALAVAGVVGGGMPLWEMPYEQAETVMDIDLWGVWRLARAAVPALLDRPEPRSGRFVAVASAAATKGMSGLATYSAAKAGVTGLIRGLAADLRGTGVTANAVSPGSIATPALDATARLYDLRDAADFAQHHLLERLLEPEEVAAALTWLAGPEASGLTGAVVPVDAGLSI